MQIEDQTFFVTGAAGGLGRQLVRQALDRGAARVYAAARRPVDLDDPRVLPVLLDVTDAAAVEAAAARAQDVTVLVNNAGITGAPSLLTSPIEDVRATFETNVLAPLVLTRAFAPTLARHGGGAVVDVHSVLSWLAQPGAYSPSKAAFWGLTNTLRIELAGQGTQVLGVHLGYADTPMTARLAGVAKTDPAVVVAAVLDALAAGEQEAVVDEVSRQVRRGLGQATTGVPAAR